MTMPASPYRLPWSPEQSAAAHKKRKANCGPHSIAAALSLDLHTVLDAIPAFRGWMNQTQVRDTLHALGVPLATTGWLKVRWLCNGLNRIQWEGPWLDRGRPRREACKHTHWVAHWEDFVLCTAVDANAWLPVDRWTEIHAARGATWHVTHHYRLLRPPALATTPAAPADVTAAVAEVIQFEFATMPGGQS